MACFMSHLPKVPDIRSRRPRVGGTRLPALEQVLQDSEPISREITVDGYGEGKRTVQMCTGTAWCCRSGYDPFPIRWVLTRDPKGERPRNPPSFPLIPSRQQNRSSAAHFALGFGSDL
jgi:hypothetical protein